MGMMVEKVLTAKIGLNESFVGLLRGFEVCTVICSIVAPETLIGFPREAIRGSKDMPRK